MTCGHLLRGAALAVACLVACGACASVVPHRALPHLALDDPSARPTLEAYAGMPIVGGNTVDILLNDAVFPAELAAIRAARTTIDYEQYYYEAGTVGRTTAAALAERCRAGVGVNVLLDAVGALEMAPEDATLMTRSGCHLAYFRPLTHLFFGHFNNRDHRRILVVDGRIGFTGGAGAGDKWLGNGRTAEHWRETDVRIEGPAVHELQAAFARAWLAATGVVLGGPAYFPVLGPTGGVPLQVVAGAPARGNESVYTTFVLAIASARRFIHITNPYFLPDERMTRALLAAAARGVDVTVLLPGQIDHKLVRQASRAGFGRLLRGGLRIEEYQPALLHAKTMIVDGVWATVGSTNFDNRSFALNAEVNVVAYGPEVAQELEAEFRDDVRYARPVRYRRWRARDLWSRFLEVLAAPLRSEL